MVVGGEEEEALEEGDQGMNGWGTSWEGGVGWGTGRGMGGGRVGWGQVEGGWAGGRVEGGWVEELLHGRVGGWTGGGRAWVGSKCLMDIVGGWVDWRFGGMEGLDGGWRAGGTGEVGRWGGVGAEGDWWDGGGGEGRETKIKAEE